MSANLRALRLLLQECGCKALRRLRRAPPAPIHIRISDEQCVELLLTLRPIPHDEGRPDSGVESDDDLPMSADGIWSPLQKQIVELVDRQPGLSAKEIAAELGHLDGSQQASVKIRGVLDTLEEAGALTRDGGFKLTPVGQERARRFGVVPIPADEAE